MSKIPRIGGLVLAIQREGAGMLSIATVMHGRARLRRDLAMTPDDACSVAVVSPLPGLGDYGVSVIPRLTPGANYGPPLRG